MRLPVYHQNLRILPTTNDTRLDDRVLHRHIYSTNWCIAFSFRCGLMYLCGLLCWVLLFCSSFSVFLRSLPFLCLDLYALLLIFRSHTIAHRTHTSFTRKTTCELPVLYPLFRLHCIIYQSNLYIFWYCPTDAVHALFFNNVFILCSHIHIIIGSESRLL